MKAQESLAEAHISLRSADCKIPLWESSHADPEERGAVDRISTIPIPITDFDGDVIERDYPCPYPCPFPSPDNYLRQTHMIGGIGNRHRSRTDYMQIPKSMKLAPRLKARVGSKHEVTDVPMCSTSGVKNGSGHERPCSAMTDCDSPGRSSSAPNPMSTHVELHGLLLQLGSRRPSTYSSSSCTHLPSTKGGKSWKIVRTGRRLDLRIPSDKSGVTVIRKEEAKGPSLSLSLSQPVPSINEVSEGEREQEMKGGSIGANSIHTNDDNIRRDAVVTSVNQSPLQCAPHSEKRIQVPDGPINLNLSTFVFLPAIHQPNMMLPWTGCAAASSPTSSSPSSSFYVKSNRRGSNDDVINLRSNNKCLNSSISTRRKSLNYEYSVALVDVKQNGVDKNTKINPLKWKNWKDEEILRKLGLSRYNYKTREIEVSYRENNRSPALKKTITENVNSAHVVSGTNNYSQEARKHSLMRNQLTSSTVLCIKMVS